MLTICAFKDYRQAVEAVEGQVRDLKSCYHSEVPGSGRREEGRGGGQIYRGWRVER